MRTVFAREKRLALNHLSEDAAGTPDVHSNIIFSKKERGKDAIESER